MGLAFLQPQDVVLRYVLYGQKKLSFALLRIVSGATRSYDRYLLGIYAAMPRGGFVARGETRLNALEHGPIRERNLVRRKPNNALTRHIALVREGTSKNHDCIE